MTKYHSIYRLVYGFYMNSDMKLGKNVLSEDYTPKLLFHAASRHEYLMYGKPDGEGLFGFTIGEISGLYENFTVFQNNSKIVNPNTAINDYVDSGDFRNDLDAIYPDNTIPHDAEMKRYVILDDVYTSHYANGDFMYGYVCKYVGDDEDFFEDFSIDVTNDNGKVDVAVATYFAHSHAFSGGHFIGLKLLEVEGLECLEDSDLYETLTSELDVKKSWIDTINSQNFKDLIQAKDLEITIPSPVITFVPTMCPCCT